MINDLTKRLLAEGWTRDHHPDYVYWSDWENFGYTWEYRLQTRWMTSCGLHVEPRRTSIINDISYGGVWYCLENDNPVVRCPYGRKDCPHNIPGLKFPWCVMLHTEEPYDPEHSLEKVEREINARRHERYMEITGGAYCVNVVDGNGSEPGTVHVDYDVERCISYGCRNEICIVTKQKRDLRKVNIYYDIRRTWKTRKGFLEDEKTAIEKGVKVFPKPVARTDAEIWLATKKAQFDPFRDRFIIDPHLTGLDRQQEYFSEQHRRWEGLDYFEFRYSVENIRIEARETRDLLQDLQDVENGIEVYHASDALKAAKEQKKAKRADSAQKNVRWAEKTLRSTDWIALDDFERRKIYRYLGEKRVDEILEEMYDTQKQPEPDDDAVEQISFWGK